MIGSLGALVLALRVAAQQGAPAVPSVWVEPRGLGGDEAKAIVAEVYDRVDRNHKLVAPRRREEADLLLRLEVTAAGSTGDNEGATGARLLEEVNSNVREPVEASQGSAAVRLTLVDLLSGNELLSRRIAVALPLYQGKLLQSAPLRSGLTDVVRRMERFVDESQKTRVSSASFGPTTDERAKLEPAGLARSLYREALRANRAGFGERALNLLAECQPLFKQSGLREEEGRAWAQLAMLMTSNGRSLDTTETYAKQAIRIGREVSSPRIEPGVVVNLGILSVRRERYDEAQALFENARDMARERQDLPAEATAVVNLAGLKAARGRFADAQKDQQEALDLVLKAQNPVLEARARLAMAAVESFTDDRDLAKTLARLDDVRRASRALGDASLERDLALVEADVRYGSTNLRHLQDGETAAVRALRLSRQLEDVFGEAAALGLLGAFSQRLGRHSLAVEYLLQAIDKSRAIGFTEGLIDSLQILGEAEPDFTRGVEILSQVVSLRKEQGDRRGEAKTLSDLSRLLSGLDETERALRHYREASGVVSDYVSKLGSGSASEDLRQSFVMTIKSLITTRTETPYLSHFLKIDRMTVPHDPSWEPDEGPHSKPNSIEVSK